MANKRINIVQFCTNTLQAGNRIKLPDSLIHTLEWKQGQDITINLDVDNQQIILSASILLTKQKKHSKR